MKRSTNRDVDESIADDARELVPPAAHDRLQLAEVVGMCETHAARDAGQVAQVEYVVELSRRRW